jgi:beta-galactosidase
MLSFLSGSSFEIEIAASASSAGEREGPRALGTGTAPDGATLGFDALSLWRDGKRWMPVMGEFHYSRYPAEGWREELRKMRAGGIDLVASYVFWIHHEEEKGTVDWSGQRHLRRFVETAGEEGLLVIVRMGPWCHGEVRNGGLPDWILEGHGRVRSDDPPYLAEVERFHAGIAAQLEGLLWKDGGPVVGVQIENEYAGPAEHLLTLKSIARAAGIDVPLYTRTGWPMLATPMPADEILPLFGAYAEGFWDRELTSMPGQYWAAFRFSPVRTDAAIGTDQLGERVARDEADAHRHPYLTCELGGGMVSSYHRRIFIEPRDIETVALVKVGSGGNAPGYYMYHGGINPTGRLSTLQESQATGYWNDSPVRDYDFQAPLGAYGQVRAHYHGLRRMHLCWRDFGSWIAGLPAHFPPGSPPRREDPDTLRWAVRSEGTGGLLFVSNHERGRHLPEQVVDQFTLRLPERVLSFPDHPFVVPSGAGFFWPFGMELASGLTLAWATAQPVCQVPDGEGLTIFFSATAGIPPRFAWEGEVAPVAAVIGWESSFERRAADGTRVRVVVLPEVDSRRLWKDASSGTERVFWSEASLSFAGKTVGVRAVAADALGVGVYPAVEGGPGTRRGLFQWWSLGADEASGAAVARVVEGQLVRPAGPPREVGLGPIARAVAEAPSEPDFEAAAEWRLELPRDLDLERDPLLRIEYLGDVARVLLDGELLLDDFHHGRPLELGLGRYGRAILAGDLRLQILPLREEAPIFRPQVPEAAFRELGGVRVALELGGITVIEPREAVLRLP